MTQVTKPANNPQSQENKWQPYNLDHKAQELIIKYRDISNDVLGESHKMRMTVAYGLERFWGEHLRFERSSNLADQHKAQYWKSVWISLADILNSTDIKLPDGDGSVTLEDSDKIKQTTKAIWQMPLDHQRVVLMVLTQLCDSLVWWTQRYKIKSSNQ